MISILIVDDEATICESIATMLRQHYPDKFELHMAHNGRQAIEQARLHRAALILADIKMPVLSGLDMIDGLKACGYDCEVIFISGFDDYAFVRQAMKHGAMDYLLKPISEEELCTQIDSFLKRWVLTLRNPSREVDRAADWENPYFQQRLLDTLAFQPDQAQAALGSHMRIGDQTRVLVFALSSRYREAIGQWQQRLQQAMAAMAPVDDYRILQGIWQQMHLSMVIGGETEIRRFLAQLSQRNALPAPVVQATPVPLARLEDSLGECRTLLDRRFYNLPGEEGPEHYPYTQLIAQLTDAICQYCIDPFEALFALLVRRVCAQFPPILPLKHMLSAMVYTVMQRNPAFVPIISQMELTPDDLIRCIQNATDMTVLAGEVPRIVRLQIHHIQAKTASSEAYHVACARQFIEQHYASNLSLADLANHVTLHPNYISSIFKRACGMSFSRYLRHVRIREACRLIRETNEKLYTIGEQVGYPDSVHFARIFKEDMGCSPSEYRRVRSPRDVAL